MFLIFFPVDVFWVSTSKLLPHVADKAPRVLVPSSTTYSCKVAYSHQC